MCTKWSVQCHKAFTLIELLVGVAIIGTLVSILMPAVASAKRQAQITGCQAKLREVSHALWSYSVSNDSRLPYVVSPMTNNAYGNDSVADADVNPFDTDKWDRSLQNILMPMYLGTDERLWICPAATIGWPRKGGTFRMTYRDAGANQPNGVVPGPDDPPDYFREAFGFLDGRPMNEYRFRLTDNVIVNSQRTAALRGTYIRDLIQRDGAHVRGPHNGGINVINREFGIEYRPYSEIQADLAPNGTGSKF